MSHATAPYSTAPSAARPLRLWPGVAIVLLYWAALKVPGWLMPGTMEQFYISGIGSMVMVLAFAAWWWFFTRMKLTHALSSIVRALSSAVSWLFFSGSWLADRYVGLLACTAIGAVAWHFLDPSWFAKQANEPPDQRAMRVTFNLSFHMLPIVTTACIVWLLIARSMSRSARLTGLVVVLAGAWGYFDTLRFNGVTGGFQPEYSWRWDPRPEDTLLASRAAGNVAASSVADTAGGKPLEVTSADWPGFRGPDRDGRRTGVRIATDWNQQRPKQLWRHPVGPGWSSFAVVGSRLYTQEQLGDDERVVCYDADTGKELWAHTDQTRFDEQMGGPGPRATPTFYEGKIYAQGANGQLNCLDAATGKKIWSRDIAVDSGRDVAPTPEEPKVPIWGFSASPLVVGGIVTVFAGGPNGKAVLAYRADTGEPAWTAGTGSNTYCSTQAVKLDGVEQLAVATGEGLLALEAASGKVLWQYEWPIGKQFNRVTQPAVIGESDLLIGTGFGLGTHRVHVSRDGSAWKAEKVWDSNVISPYYNDLVVHKGHLYGFNGELFECINADTHKVTWKERGYANGQVLLLPDQDLLLIVTEKGDVALVEAKPEKRVELGRFTAFKGKTWNHPVVAHGKLFVRNGEEMACYQLTEASTARP